jgi:arginyl-tRNA synthetase
MSLKQVLHDLIKQSLDQLHEKEALELDDHDIIQIEKTRDEKHGDFATNIAMVLSGKTGEKPRYLAEKIIRGIPRSELIEKIEIAGPGFINFFLTRHAHLQVINSILNTGNTYGCSGYGKGKSILIEFVSANPTGPLHIGHGRGAAYGAATANLLESIGYKVDREYYINDAGRQMDILATSIYLRYLEKCGVNLCFPETAYQGDYVKAIADRIYDDNNESLKIDTSGLEASLNNGTDSEKQLDCLIEYIKSTLGNAGYDYIFDAGLNEILADINNDLVEFGVIFNHWFSERELLASNEVNDCIETLKKNGHLYETEGAVWFRTTEFGDEKDRVVIRENGQLTYFASDIAYHKSKFGRGYDRIIDVWGADHHGYMTRIKAALSALKLDASQLDILLVQFASLYRGDNKIQMSTRSGQFVTLRELRNEVGKDASRFFYVMRKSDQHLDFDLELAKSQSQDNPVYYIQYAHARICSIKRQMLEKGLKFALVTDTAELDILEDKHELTLLATLAAYPETVLTAANNYEPHQIAYYLRDLAHEFHTYYNACQILVDDKQLRNARVSLVSAIQQVIQNGLNLLGVSAPEAM